MEKKIDELIEKYVNQNKSIKGGILWMNNYKLVQLVKQNDKYIQDLETLKAELKEQHKKDVVNAYFCGMFTYSLFSFLPTQEQKEEYAEQYYNENHQTDENGNPSTYLGGKNGVVNDCSYFVLDPRTSSATLCMCGKQQFEHNENH